MQANIFYKQTRKFQQASQMSFEVKEKDLLGRIGKLKTKSGTVETPLLFPVINPNIQLIPTQKLKDQFGFEAVITNAYILRKRYAEKVSEKGLHKFLNFNGVTMTDSGAYQILVYGGVEVNQAEIVQYQEGIGTDIATMLDIPTGWHVKKPEATQTVKETLKRAKQLFKQKTRNDMLWVGPVQGGRHLDLVAKSAKAMSQLPFNIHALGSPTEVMENYRYDILTDMILTAKMNLPQNRPLHLFGAGHPHMLALAVALGCDLFDSAAYALYARESRYMTENGTWHLNELDYFPCQCPNCATQTPKTVQAMPKPQQETFLAEHNLHTCQAELKRIKQAIKDGRLWEHIEMRAHNHPALLTALKKTRNYADFIEQHSPTVKPSGFFYFDSVGLTRPEVTHYCKRLNARYQPPLNAKTLLLVPQTPAKPFHKAPEFKKVRQTLRKTPNADVHVCFYAAPFGVIPMELDEVYPLSQHETALPLDLETVEYVANQVAAYVQNTNYAKVVLLHDPKNWSQTVTKALKKTCKQKHIPLTTLTVKANDRKPFPAKLQTALTRGKTP
jgi:7-cyano-7-deazaguanine tRNA-ribosyltransferase